MEIQGCSLIRKLNHVILYINRSTDTLISCISIDEEKVLDKVQPLFIFCKTVSPSSN
jgi:hypothetical protein